MQHTLIGTSPDDFCVVRLRDVLVANDAGVWGLEPVDNEGVVTIRSTNFTNEGRLDLTDVASRTLSPGKHEEKRLYLGDILIERSGGSDTQPVGRVGFVSSEIAKRNPVFANFIQRIRVSEEMDPRYVYLALLRLYQLGITQAMQFQTTGIRNLDFKFYLRTVIPKPRKAEQQTIASALFQVDQNIVGTETSIAAAKKLRQALMQNLLTGKLKPDGTLRREDEYHVDPKFGRVPKRWSVKKGKILFRIHGSTASKDSRGAPLGTTCLFMKVDDFNTPANDPLIVETESSFESPSPKPVYPCKPGWIVVAKRGAAISHNRVRILAREAILDPNLMAIEMLGEESPEYFRYLLLLERLDRYSEVSSIPQLNNKDLYPRSFVMPPPDEQSEILRAIELVEAVVKCRNEKLSSLRTLKTALMQNLLTGKIRIPAE